MRSRSWRRFTDAPRRRWSFGLRRGASLARRVLVRGGSRVEATAPVSPALPPVLDAASSVPSIASEHPVPKLLTGPRTAERRLAFLLVNACTVASLALGLLAIVLAAGGSPRWAAVLLLGCIAFDGLDGALARRLGVATPFGAQMDSLADMCSFGVATPVVAYAWLAGSVPALVVVPACALVTVCAAIRLARFNISPKDSRYFSGVPTTMAATIIVAFTLLLPDPTQLVPAAVLAVLIATVALLMVSSFPYVKFSQLRRVPRWLWLAPIAAGLASPALAIVSVITIYLASGPLLWVRGSRA